MIWHNIDPRTEKGRQDWLQLRCGIPTASEFHKIITPKTLQLSKQRDEHMDRLLEEWITGEPIEDPRTEWMQYGIELEDQAVSAYEAIREETTVGGFFTTDDGLVGGSPDRLVGDRGDLEIKCGALRTTIGHYRRGGIDAEHRLQIQGRLWLHGREWVEVFAYHPAMILQPVRANRDEKAIAAIAAGVTAFVGEMMEARLKIEREFGPFIRRPREAPPLKDGEILDGVTMDDVEAILEARR